MITINPQADYITLLLEMIARPEMISLLYFAFS